MRVDRRSSVFGNRVAWSWHTIRRRRRRYTRVPARSRDARASTGFVVRLPDDKTQLRPPTRLRAARGSLRLPRSSRSASLPVAHAEHRWSTTCSFSQPFHLRSLRGRYPLRLGKLFFRVHTSEPPVRASPQYLRYFRFVVERFATVAAGKETARLPIRVARPVRVSRQSRLDFTIRLYSRAILRSPGESAIRVPFSR